MRLFSIMNLNTNHIDEICEDIKKQYETGVCDCALFSMTLTPEGNPVSDKASMLCQKYMQFKNKLDSMGLKSGILVQATIGHGYVLGESSPFTKYVNFNDGKTVEVCCPYDEDFRKYIYDAFVKIAKCSPDHIMVDDDLRLISWRGDGCACNLHMDKFNEYAKTNICRETLFNMVGSHKEYMDIFVKTQKESLVDLAKVMRKAIDSVNPKLSGSFCCVGKNAEFAHEIASVLSGENNEIIVRINNGHYCAERNHKFSDVFLRAAQSIEKLKGKVDVILAETDTCPQNRYSTSAISLHTHFTGTILEGASGAKHWITKLDNYEPESGLAYRKTLSKYSGFYEALANLTPQLKWKGFRIPVRNVAIYNIGNNGCVVSNGWSSDVFERLGLPIFFSSEIKGITALEGKLGEEYTDEKIIELLKGKMFLASDTAKEIIDRGFGEYLGVDIRKWEGKNPIKEEILLNNKYIRVQQQYKEIVPLSDNVQIYSKVYNTKDNVNLEYLFPGVTMFKNSLGGEIVVFCGTPKVEWFNYTTAFSFLNRQRKLQLIDILKTLGEDICYYPGDEEVYMKTADMADKTFCAIFNLGLDVIENMKIAVNKGVSSIKMLMPNGEYKDVKFSICENEVQTNICCNTLEPVILIINH